MPSCFRRAWPSTSTLTPSLLSLRASWASVFGLITFAAYADSRSPLTLDKAFLAEVLRQTEIVSPEEGRDEDGTAIGDAIGFAVERLVDMDRRRSESSAQKINSKIMILLTDGENNAGDIDPITATKMAAAFDIKVYTIGAGTDASMAPVPVRDPFTGRLGTQMIRVSIDERTLREIAAITGGRYFRSTDRVTLKEVYRQIDQLERTRIEQRRYTDYRELAVEPVRLAGVTLPPLLSGVVVLLGLSVVLANTRFRTLP